MKGFIFKTIEFLEKKRFDILGIFLFITIVSGIRMFLETKIFGYAPSKMSYYYIFYYYHFISFYITVFIGSILIMKWLTGEKLIKIANLASIGFIIIWIAPIVDKYVFNYGRTYSYIPKDQFFYFMLFLYPKIHGVAGAGLGIQFILILILTTLYVYIKTSSILKSIGNLFLINSFTAFLSTPSINPLIEKLSLGTLSQPLYILRYTIISLILIFLLMKILRKGFLKSFLKSMGLIRAFHFILMGLIGIAIAGMLKMHLNYENAGNIGIFGITIFTIFFLWEYAVMINNLYDIEIDKISKKERITAKGFLSLKNIRDIAIIFAIISIAFSFSLGIYQLILSIISIFLATIYSAPPLRLRNKIFSNSFIGIGSSICFSIGYMAPRYIEVNGITYRIYPTISPNSIWISILIFVALFAGSLVKDIDDYEGDLKSGVKNIFTIYGIEKGIKIASVPVFISFLTPLLLIHAIYDFIILSGCGIIATFLFNKMKKSKVVFLFYIIAIIYSILRYFNK